MSSKPADCERPDCQWVKTTRNPDVYFCLRCVKEQKLEEKKPPPKPKSNPLLTFLMVLAAFLVISAILGSTESQSYQPVHWDDDYCWNCH